MFAWLPIIGPIISGIVDVFKAKEDTKVKTLQTLSDQHNKDVAAVTSVVVVNSGKPEIRVLTTMLALPPVVWTGTIVWDKWIESRYPELVWGVNPLPEVIGWLPYATMVFLLGAAAILGKK